MGCDYCDEGNQPVDGWHTYSDPDDFLPGMKIPCTNNPPAPLSPDTKISPDQLPDTSNQQEER